MGGIFSGRWGWHRKKTRVDQCRSFAVAALVGDTPPTAGHAARFEWRGDDRKTVLASICFGFVTASRVVLGYAWGEGRKQIDLPFDLVPLPTPNGGTRYLAICPMVASGVPCQRRVTRLYLPPGSRYFGCRVCHRLAYRSGQGHDKRVTAILRSGQLAELTERPGGKSVVELGLILAAIREHDRRCERALRRFDPKPKARRRKSP